MSTLFHPGAVGVTEESNALFIGQKRSDLGNGPCASIILQDLNATRAILIRHLVNDHLNLLVWAFRGPIIEGYRPFSSKAVSVFPELNRLLSPHL
jgi:hypothetical protein